MSHLLGRPRPSAAKLSTYECGMPPVGTARERFPIKFYLVCMIFILLDVDAAFLYPWALVFQGPRASSASWRWRVFMALLGGGFVVRVEVGRARLVGEDPAMQLTPDNKARFDEILKRYPVKRSALLPALHLVQEQEGWISREAIEHVAGLLDLTPRAGPRHRELLHDVPAEAGGRRRSSRSARRSPARSAGRRSCSSTPAASSASSPAGRRRTGSSRCKGVECLAACGGRPRGAGERRVARARDGRPTSTA